ncbi:hypothetical protein ACIBBE_42300 [Streptomyces sp. NPDC051644]|uniref:hypothetical protein n=1 Tax=Streptomyces sp. NPDC051644 TaxID=3365666 RepID=UPI0037A24431
MTWQEYCLAALVVGAIQLAHLMRMADSGTTIRVVADKHPDPRPSGHLVELTFAAGCVAACPGEGGVRCDHARNRSCKITAALKTAASAPSHEALEQAVEHHRSAAQSMTGPL